MNQLIDWDRLARYIARESSPGERAEVERWASSDPSRRAVLDEVRARWGMAGADGAWAGAAEAIDVSAAWGRLLARLRDPSAGAASDDVVLPNEQAATALRSAGLRRLALPVAAALVAAAGLGFWQLARRDGSLGQASLAVRPTEHSVPPGGGQRALTLSDGSEVILASGSRLVVAPGFGVASRAVDLEGEAAFRVQHDATRPFRVRAGSMVAEDLGTEFVVRHVTEGERIRVAVREGVVAVRASGVDGAGGAGDTLRARDVAVFSGGDVLVRHDQDLGAYFAWTEGRLVFDDTPLREVAAELSRWFDLDVQVDSSIAGRPYSNTILTSSPVDEVLQVVGMGADVRVERRGRVVRFTGSGYTGALPSPRAEVRREVAG